MFSPTKCLFQSCRLDARGHIRGLFQGPYRTVASSVQQESGIIVKMVTWPCHLHSLGESPRNGDATVNEKDEEKRKATGGVFLDKNGYSAEEIYRISHHENHTLRGVAYTPGVLLIPLEP